MDTNTHTYTHTRVGGYDDDYDGDNNEPTDQTSNMSHTLAN